MNGERVWGPSPSTWWPSACVIDKTISFCNQITFFLLWSFKTIVITIKITNTSVLWLLLWVVPTEGNFTHTVCHLCVLPTTGSWCTIVTVDWLLASSMIQSKQNHTLYINLHLSLQYSFLNIMNSKGSLLKYPRHFKCFWFFFKKIKF